jgi:hypothetical protein
MSIYVTGDIHGSLDIEKLNTKMFPEQKNLTKNDYVIILGDFGLTWNDGDECKYWLKWLNDKNFTTLFIDGNHDNFDLLYKYPIVEFLGGKTHQIRESIYYLMRGEIFTIEELTFFAFGGGISIDRAYRIEGRSWWAQEVPNYAEIENGFVNLEKYNNTVDYVLTHAAPSGISLNVVESHHCEADEVTKILDAFEEKINCKKWFFGHHHIDKVIDDKFRVLYNTIVKLN